VRCRREADLDRHRRHVLMQAVVTQNLSVVQASLMAGVDVDERYPRVNGFDDGLTPLHVASRDGTPEIVAALLMAGADVNAVEPCFQSVPVHRAVYNGHVEITRLLVAHPGIDLDYQGGTNGYTALHDALRHGYETCAQILVEAGARVDLRGHDGRTAVDVAGETLGLTHPVTAMIRDRQASSASRRGGIRRNRRGDTS
jgi:uncharacterized protein